MRFALFIFSIYFLSTSFVQCQTAIDTLRYSDFILNVMRYHPLALQADLKIDQAEAQTLVAKGALDPKLKTGWSSKNFDNKLYFRKYDASIKVPTTTGVQFIAGYENTLGQFINQENTITNRGLWNIGIEADILQGLLMNDRKVALEQAALYSELANFERQILLNQLMYEAAVSYVLWQQFSEFNGILLENERLAQSYFNNTKQSFTSGEKTAMDTLEATIALQDAGLLRLKLNQKLIKATENLETYLWLDQSPAQLLPTVKPEQARAAFYTQITSLENIVIDQHPIILSYQNKISTLRLDLRLKREKLKPKLKVKYNPLLATSQESIAPNVSVNDFKFGFNFSMPLLFRGARGQVDLGNIKIKETEYLVENKRNELLNKLESIWQEYDVKKKQAEVISNNVNDYKTLLDGENIKYQYGESSFFLLNKRQEKYIEGLLKEIEVGAELKLLLLEYLFLSNQLM